MNYKKFVITLSGCLLSVVMNASQTSASMSALSSSSSSSAHSANASSRATTPMPTAITPRNSVPRATAQNTLGGLSINNEVLDKTADRLAQKFAQALKDAGKEVTAALKTELQTKATEILAQAKRTGNEVSVRAGEILLNSGERLLVVCVIVGTVIYLLTNHPVLAVVLITSFLSAPALYLQSRGELRPLIREFVNAYGHTARLQHELETTTQTLENTNRTLAETRATLEATRATAETTAKLLAEVSAKVNTGRQ